MMVFYLMKLICDITDDQITNMNFGKKKKKIIKKSRYEKRGCKL